MISNLAPFCIGDVGRSLLFLGATATITASTATAAISTTQGVNYLSLYVAEKEAACKEESWQAVACNVGKWALLVLSAVVGIVGSACFGFSVYFSVQILTLCSMDPLAIISGIACTLLLGSYIEDGLVFPEYALTRK